MSLKKKVAPPKEPAAAPRFVYDSTLTHDGRTWHQHRIATSVEEAEAYVASGNPDATITGTVIRRACTEGE